MTAGTRGFFELERLWSAAPVIYRAPGPDHSSKSS
jgi:ribosomal silencing factor RsfS